MTYRKRNPRPLRAAALFLILALLIPAALPTSAAVTLTEFSATPQDNGTIRITWAAATELDIASYQLFRADTPSPTGWGSPIYEVAAGGSVSPANYEHIDGAVTPGVTYYYMLSDISVGGDVGENGPVQARISMGNETATYTPTATATLNPNVPTATTGPGSGSGGIVGTATLTSAPPTATRQYTNTPVSAPVGTAGLTSPTVAVVVTRVTPTVPVVGAAIVTPTGQPLLPTTAPAALLPTALPATLPPMPSPTDAVVAQVTDAGPQTATPVPAREVTPVVFAASETQEPTAVTQQDVASQGSRNMNTALAIGGGALGLAGLLAAAWLFLRSRKA